MTGTILGAVAVIGVLHLRAQDPVKLSPKYWKVHIDNDRVRVLEYHLKPGEREPMHSHPSGVVFYLSEAQLRITHADGTNADTAVHAGEVLWREDTSHAVENIG